MKIQYFMYSFKGREKEVKNIRFVVTRLLALHAILDIRPPLKDKEN